jgi:transketolase
MGGSADLQPSNGTALKNYPAFQKTCHNGRYLHFGVREHAMAAICNGLAAYGMNTIPFGATFLNFIEYAYGAVRVCAISNFRVLWIMTHDSIGLGEDGPTHQPVEASTLIRATPNILFLRPGDGNEVTGAYIVALENTTRSSVLSLSRQTMPNLEGTSAEKVSFGAYPIITNPNAQVILVGTGSELSLCVDAAKQLQDLNPQVVSMPSFELFEEQSQEYQDSVFTPGVPVVSIEAMTTVGWERFSHIQIGMRSFGASAPGKDTLKHFNITADNLVQKARLAALSFPSRSAPDLRKIRALAK